MTDSNTETRSALAAAEQAAKAATDEHAAMQEKLEVAKKEHAHAEVAYDASGGIDEAWTKVERCASALARAVRDEARLARAAKDAAHAHAVAKIADLASRANALKSEACLGDVLPPYLDKLRVLYESLKTLEIETLEALEKAELKQAEILHLQIEAEDLQAQLKTEHPDRGGFLPRFPDMIRRRNSMPHEYIREQLTSIAKPDPRDLRVALLPTAQTTEEQDLMRPMRDRIAADTREALKALSRQRTDNAARSRIEHPSQIEGQA